MIILSKLNYLFEAIAYYDRRANGMTLSNARTSFISSGDNAEISHAVALTPLTELESILDRELLFSKEQIDFFFKGFDPVQGSISCDNRAMLLFRMFIQHDLPLDSVIDKMLLLSDEEFANVVVFSMNGLGEVTMSKIHGGLSDYFELLNRSSRSNDIKWQVCDTLMQRKKYLSMLKPMLDAAINIIKENESLYAPLVNEFYDSYSQNPQLADEMAEKLGSRRHSMSSEPVCLRPLLFSPVGYYVFGDMDENDALTSADMLLGVLSTQYFSTNKPLFDAGILLSLSMLCDKTRFQLLRRIASEPAYGQQLADELGMTTPNIYHHMGKLLQAKLVSIKIDRNRNYYVINKSYIVQLLNELRDMLNC